MIAVEVAYASHNGQQVIISLQLPAESTVEIAIQNSGILQQFPEINLQTARIGIFSKLTTLSAKLAEGDRVEIYRPLRIDPKQARLLRAKRNKP